MMRNTPVRFAFLLSLMPLAFGCGADTDQTAGPGPNTLDAGGADGAADVDPGGADAALDAGTVEPGDDAGGLDNKDAAAPVDAGVADVPPTTCSDDKACDDGLACTVDTCTMPGEVCVWTLKSDTCLVAGVCRSQGAAAPDDDCQICDAKADAKGWTVATDGAACDDGKTCTVDGACKSGVCEGTPLVCGDDDPCTADVCTPGKGCQYPPGPTLSCNDNDKCTDKDACHKGKCIGQLVDCDDGNGCTVDACTLAVGCTHTDNEAACSDGDACTADDACAAGKCIAGDKANCDDGNACTIDLCNKLAGCAHLPTQSPCCTGKVSICDDGDPCTTDLCDPKTSGCSQENNTAACDDGNACTSKDACKAGKCAGKAIGCDDGSPCTSDACDKAKGCVHGSAAEGQPCDDGNPCTKADACTGGACVGSGKCACTPSFSKLASKLVTMQLGTSGKPGQGLNLDQDIKTCAPKNNCSDGIDNALAAVASFANKSLQEAVDKGSILMLVEFKDFKQGPIELAIHQGELSPDNAKCDVQKKTCKWLADPSLVDALTCKPKAAMAGTLVGSKLVAGGKGTTFPFNLPLSEGADLKLTLYDLRIEGTLKVAGGAVQKLDAILGGAVPKTELLAAIDALPEDGLPFPKATIKSLLDAMVAKDIDTNGDGVKNASSIALVVSGIAAQIVGVGK